MKIGQIIRNLRVAKKATLEEIAFAAEMDAANLSRIERDKQNPTVEIVEKLAAAFDLPVSALYLMAEQTATSAHRDVKSQPIKNQALEDVVSRFMLLSTQNQVLVAELMRTMLELQKSKKEE